MSIRYLHLVQKITEPMKQGLEEVPRRGGMYNWMFLFKGQIIQWNDVLAMGKKFLEQFDVIQLNLAPSDQLLLPEVRKMLGNNSSTLIIANNDYVCEYWDLWSQHPVQYFQYQDYADAVFGTEKYQVSQMREDAYVLPHPHWIKMLKRIGNDDLEPERFKIGVLYHWWEGRGYMQSSVLHKLRKKFPKIITRLYAYEGSMDRSRGWKKTLFDKTMPLMNYPDFIGSLQTNRFIYENCHFHTYGRTSVDTAALGIPTMGTDRVWSMRHCWPEMSCDPCDAKKQLEIMEKILEGGEWLHTQMSHAHGACEYFNYPNSERRYLEMVEDVRKRLKK